MNATQERHRFSNRTQRFSHSETQIQSAFAANRASMAERIPKTSIKAPSVCKYKPHIQTPVGDVCKIKRALDPHNLGHRAPVQ